MSLQPFAVPTKRLVDKVKNKAQAAERRNLVFEPQWTTRSQNSSINRIWKFEIKDRKGELQFFIGSLFRLKVSWTAPHVRRAPCKIKLVVRSHSCTTVADKRNRQIIKQHWKHGPFGEVDFTWGFCVERLLTFYLIRILWHLLKFAREMYSYKCRLFNWPHKTTLFILQNLELKRALVIDKYCFSNIRMMRGQRHSCVNLSHHTEDSSFLLSHHIAVQECERFSDICHWIRCLLCLVWGRSGDKLGQKVSQIWVYTNTHLSVVAMNFEHEKLNKQKDGRAKEDDKPW